METKKQDAVVYIDGYGREHDALVTAVNEREQGYVTLVYVDVNAPEPENVKKLFDIAHVLHASKQEPNPELPSYDVNAWKQRGELHRALPEDHPAFDHPFLPAKVDEAGNVIPIDRPKTVAEAQAHQDAMVKRMGIDAPAKVDEFSQPKPVLVSAGPDLDRVAAFLQSRGYAIKDCHTAAKFLDSLQPHEAAGFKQEFSAWCATYQAPEQPGLPSVEDLDSDAEEYKIKAATVPQSQTPDYHELRAQLNDYHSTFYGPHECECEATPILVIRRALEQGGEMWARRDGPPHYELHVCVPKAQPVPTPILINTPEAAAPQTSALPDPTPADAALVVETKHYTDGSSATGVAPLPDQSPAQQDAAENKPEGVKEEPAEEGQTE